MTQTAEILDIARRWLQQELEKYVFQFSETLGVSDGSANQTYQTAYYPIQRGMEPVIVVGGDSGWQRVDNLSTSGNTDKHFKVVWETGEIVFGDGEHGLKPPNGETITITYLIKQVPTTLQLDNSALIYWLKDALNITAEEIGWSIDWTEDNTQADPLDQIVISTSLTYLQKTILALYIARFAYYSVLETVDVSGIGILYKDPLHTIDTRSLLQTIYNREDKLSREYYKRVNLYLYGTDQDFQLLDDSYVL